MSRRSTIPQIRKALALALDRKRFNTDPQRRQSQDRRRDDAPTEGTWGMPPDIVAELPATAPTSKEPRRSPQDDGRPRLQSANPLKVKVSTRNIPLYRDPAVILIDQLQEPSTSKANSSPRIDRLVRQDRARRLHHRFQSSRASDSTTPMSTSTRISAAVGAQLHPLLQSGRREADRPPITGDRCLARKSWCGRSNEGWPMTSPGRSSCRYASRPMLASLRQRLRPAPQRHLQQLADEGNAGWVFAIGALIVVCIPYVVLALRVAAAIWQTSREVEKSGAIDEPTAIFLVILCASFFLPLWSGTYLVAISLLVFLAGQAPLAKDFVAEATRWLPRGRAGRTLIVSTLIAACTLVVQTRQPQRFPRATIPVGEGARGRCSRTWSSRQATAAGPLSAAKGWNEHRHRDDSDPGGSRASGPDRR